MHHATRQFACLLAASMVVCGAARCALAAPPKLDYFFPAGVQRGQTAEIAAVGAFDDWPVEVWVDRPGVQVVVQEKKGQLAVTVADDAVGGVCWLRLFNAQGATQLRPLMIGSLPESLEAEPNDAADAAQQLLGSTMVNGKFAKRGDVDTYAIALKKGQTLVASMQANEFLNSPLDGVLQIADPRGFVLAQNNDARGLDPMIVFEAPADGTYLVRAFCFPAKPDSSIDFAGAENYVYRLCVTTGPFVDHAMPLAVARGQTTDVRLVGWNLVDREQTTQIAADAAAADDLVDAAPTSAAGMALLPSTPYAVLVEQAPGAQPTPLPVEVPTVVSGALAAAGEVDAYRFTAAKGQKLSIFAESRALGFPLDPVLEIVDAEGKSLAENDDAARTDRDARLTFTAPTDGPFDVRIRDLHQRGGMRFAYRLTLEPHAPSFQLTLAAGEFALPAGKTVEIPVDVKRLDGFAEEIQIAAVDLPAGVTAEEVASPAKGDAAKQVKLKLTAGENATSGLLRIVGRVGEAAPQTARFTYAGAAQSHQQVWLTVAPP
ncbi:MAG: PPC domain-containing protein [Planctomycetales bacterium]|nr:PPC domain-containing protein [Planctomycetales bacterium]